MKFADALIALILVGSVAAVGFAAADFTNPPTEPEHDNLAERVKLMSMAKVFARICHMQLNQELRDSLRTDVLDVLGDSTVASIEDSAPDPPPSTLCARMKRKPASMATIQCG